MRLDKWLKVSRLIKRRTVANEACDNARVTANGRPVKASYDVKAGDVLELRFGERTVKVEVLSVAEHVGKADAPAVYKELRGGRTAPAARRANNSPPTYGRAVVLWLTCGRRGGSCGAPTGAARTACCPRRP